MRRRQAGSRVGKGTDRQRSRQPEVFGTGGIEKAVDVTGVADRHRGDHRADSEQLGHLGRGRRHGGSDAAMRCCQLSVQMRMDGASEAYGLRRHGSDNYHRSNDRASAKPGAQVSRPQSAPVDVATCGQILSISSTEPPPSALTHWPTGLDDLDGVRRARGTSLTQEGLLGSAPASPPAPSDEAHNTARPRWATCARTCDESCGFAVS